MGEASPEITTLLEQLRDPEAESDSASERLYEALYPHLHELAE